MGGWVDADSSLGIAPLVQVFWLLNGSSNHMTVNGSSGSPIDFTFTPAGGNHYYVSNIYLYADASNVLNPTNFLSASGLTNGITITFRSMGQNTTFVNLKQNVDLFGTFDAKQGTGSAQTLGSNQNLCGNREFYPPIFITGDQSDFVRARVQDNLSALPYLAIGIVVSKFLVK